MSPTSILFDEVGMVETAMVMIVGHRRTKEVETDRQNLKPYTIKLVKNRETVTKKS
jgi:hypothetical protein